MLKYDSPSNLNRDAKREYILASLNMINKDQLFHRITSIMIHEKKVKLLSLQAFLGFENHFLNLRREN